MFTRTSRSQRRPKQHTQLLITMMEAEPRLLWDDNTVDHRLTGGGGGLFVRNVSSFFFMLAEPYRHDLSPAGAECVQTHQKQLKTPVNKPNMIDAAGTEFIGINCLFNINTDQLFPPNDPNWLKHITRCKSWSRFSRSGNRMLLHCKDLRRSPDAFNHTELGYPVTTEQSQA